MSPRHVQKANADFDARIACGVKGAGFKTVLWRMVAGADTQAKIT